MHEKINQAQPIPQTIKKIKHYSYSTNDFLGKGNFSQVYKGLNQKTNENIAIKVKDLSSLTFPKLKQLHLSEIGVLLKINHPNVVKCFEVIQEDNFCYIINELCEGGDLDMLVKKKGYLSEEQIKPLLKDILEGLIYLNQQNIVHRDLKVANVFINDGVAKIADFGFAVFARQKFKDANIGSPLYMSPEGWKQSIYGPKTEVWALGILIFELIHGDTPYVSCTFQQDLRRQLSVPFNRAKIRPTVSHDLKEVIYRCLQIDESKRISIQQLKQTPYFKRIYQELLHPSAIKTNNNFLRVNSIHRVNDPQRPRSIARLDSRQKSPQIKITFNHGNSPKTAQMGLPKPPSHLSSQQKLPFHQQPRINTLIRPISTQKPPQSKHFLPSPQPERARVVSIDRRQQIPKLKLFNPQISFKTSVNILHYCRCLFRFIQLLIQVLQEQKQIKFASNWLIFILEQMKRKAIDNEISLAGNKKQSKIQKFREVRTDYERKYSNELKKYLNNFKNRFDFEQAKVFLFLLHRKYDFLISKEQNTVHLQIGIFCVVLYDATILLKKCQQENSFSRFSNYKNMEEILLRSKIHFNKQNYSQIKKKIVVNA